MTTTTMPQGRSNSSSGNNRERIQELADALFEAYDAVQWAEVALGAERQRYRQTRQCLPHTTAAGGDVVRIDVGGTPFHVCRATLRSQPQSMLATLVSGHFGARGKGCDEQQEEDVDVAMPGRDEQQDEVEDNLFLDRDPELFPHVLNYLRGEGAAAAAAMDIDADTDADADAGAAPESGFAAAAVVGGEQDVPLPLAPHLQRALLREARFYGLDGLCRRLSAALATPTFTELSADIAFEPQAQKIVTTNTGSMTYSAGLASPSAIGHGRHSWYIRLVATPTLVFMGFAPKDAFRIEPNRAYANSYACPHSVLFYTGNGYIYTPGTPTPLKQYYTDSRDSLKASGTVIGAHIDMDTQQVAFTVNGKCFGLVQVANMSRPLFPVFELMGPGGFELWSPQP